MSYGFCLNCHEFFDERRMATETMCDRCYYSMEVNDEKKDELKAEEDRAVPGNEDGRETGTTALAGQLSLLI